MASNDPDFERKAADIIGLYLDPPQHAAMFCVDEKTAIQAARSSRSRVAAIAGTSRAPWLRVQTQRHAVTLRRLEHSDRPSARQDGRASHQPRICRLSSNKSSRGNRPSRRSTSFATTSRRTKPSASKRFSKRTRAFSSTSRRPTPRGSIKSNFGSPNCNAMVIARGVFTSTADLARKLRRYINAYSKDAKPFRWKYSDPSRRIRHA